MSSSARVFITPGYHTRRIAPHKGKTYPPEILTSDEVKALIRASSNRTPTGIRNRAVIVVMYRTGLRFGEALALRPEDIDPTSGAVTALRVTGDRRRLVGIDSGSMAIVMRWVDDRRTLGLTGRSGLFCTLQGRPLHAS